MNIIIPLGGKGERFYKEGFTYPKPLINILNKPMIFHVIDNLKLDYNDKVFIIYNSILDNYNFQEIIKNKYKEINLISVNYQTSGALETVSFGLKYIKQKSENKVCVLLDCDTFYSQDILQIIRTKKQNMVFYTKKISEPPIYSYINLNEDNLITNIKEKVKISCNANTGCYVFCDINELELGSKYILDNNITFNGEPYISCVISHMLTNNFYGYELDKNKVFSVGTPKELNYFVENTFVFLFDLDGTLVLTDDIYYDVWKQILVNYNIHLNRDIFKNLIHGNSDDKVVKSLIPNENIKEISEKKDKLFIELIHKVIIINGVIDFLKLLKSFGYFCSIVTNCNRTVAEKIIEYCNFGIYIDFLTIGSESIKPKPYPEPYLETIQKYNISKKRVIIFEDSKSGLLSARLSNPYCIVGISSNYNSTELLANGADIVEKSFNPDLLDKIFSYNNMSIENIKKYIKQSLNLNIKNIEINENKLKGGYISDVIALNIFLENCQVLNCVIKLENKNESNLSIMAKKLGLYERENYFYNSLSNYVNINVPKFYGIIKDDDLNDIGILMENLNSENKYCLNLNLNNENINISLSVLSELAMFHAKFWNKDIKKGFNELKKNNDTLFNPTWTIFINEKWDCFVSTWKNILTEKQIKIATNIKNNFSSIQNQLSENNLTLIHGDVKSPNIFYDSTNNYKPTFLDWQYVAIGKGVQDIIFFLIESFELDNIKLNYPIFKNYYYRKLKENGINHYSYTDYELDIKNAVCYFPFFVAIWFGTTPQDDLIDKNFPFFFIQKLFFFLDELF